MRRLTVLRSLVVVVVSTMLLTVGIVAAADLVVNGSFNSNLTGWDSTSASSVFSSTEGHTAAGSAFVTTDGSDPGVLEQCIAYSVPANGRVAVGAWVKQNGGTGSIEAWSFTNTDCSVDGSESQFYSETASDTPGWQGLASPTGSFAPQIVDGAGSISIRLIAVGNNEGDGAYFDDVVVNPFGPNAVTLKDFSAQPQASSAMWALPAVLLAALSGVWFMARRRRA
jgi:hypothetical protein